MSDIAEPPAEKPADFRTRWLWEPYLALGTVALLDGDPCVGKSLITLDLAARLTAGRPLPDGQQCPARAGGHTVILANAEDCLESTVVPRFVTG
jgi:hypothetical protein